MEAMLGAPTFVNAPLAPKVSVRTLRRSACLSKSFRGVCRSAVSPGGSFNRGRKTIPLIIRARYTGSGKPSDPIKLYVKVPQPEGPENQEAVSHVASESAVESGDKVHEQAKREAEPIASRAAGSVEEVAHELEKKALKASDEEAERAESGGLEEISQKAQRGWEAAFEAVQKRAKVLAEAAEDAGGKGSQVVEAAKRSFDEFKSRFSGVQESVQKNVEQLQQRFDEGNGKVLEQKMDELGVKKPLDDQEVEKHKAVFNEDVNTEGEGVLQKQRKQEEEDADAVAKTIKEFVDPVLDSVRSDLEEEDEIGDGNEHLKNMNDLVAHDSYDPIVDESQGKQ